MTYRFYRQGTRAPARGELGAAGRTYNGIINIGVPFDLRNIHTHNTPKLWAKELNDAYNFNPLSLILTPLNLSYNEIIHTLPRNNN